MNKILVFIFLAFFLLFSKPLFASDGSGLLNKSGEKWWEAKTFYASGGDVNDSYGHSVSYSLPYMIVGAIHESSSSSEVNGDRTNNDLNKSGAAYVYSVDLETGEWIEEAYLKPQNPSAQDLFGYHVAIDDGIAVVGAPNEDSSFSGINGTFDETKSNSGAIYIFEKGEDKKWRQTAMIKEPLINEGNNFGSDFVLHKGVIVAGSSKADTDGLNSSGAAYVYEKNDSGEWHLKSTLSRPYVDASDNFGSSVAIYNNQAVVCAMNEDGVAGDISVNQKNSSGACYFYVNKQSGWGYHGFLKASNADEYDQFGYSVVMDKDRIFIASINQGGGGAVYPYVYENESWVEKSYIKIPNLHYSNQNFGRILSVKDDYLIVASSDFIYGYRIKGGRWQPIHSDRLEYNYTLNGVSADDFVSFYGVPRTYNSKRGRVDLMPTPNDEYFNLSGSVRGLKSSGLMVYYGYYNNQILSEGGFNSNYLVRGSSGYCPIYIRMRDWPTDPYQTCAVTSCPKPPYTEDLTNVEIQCYDSYPISINVNGLDSILDGHIKFYISVDHPSLKWSYANSYFRGGHTPDVSVNKKEGFRYNYAEYNYRYDFPENSKYEVSYDTYKYDYECNFDQKSGITPSEALTINASCEPKDALISLKPGWNFPDTGSISVQLNNDEIVSVRKDVSVDFTKKVKSADEVELKVVSSDLPSGYSCGFDHNLIKDIAKIRVVKNMRPIYLYCTGPSTQSSSITISGTVEGANTDGYFRMSFDKANENFHGDEYVDFQDGVFSFKKYVKHASEYELFIVSHPENPSRVCSVASPSSGTFSDQDLTNIVVDCKLNKYNLNFYVSGLEGEGFSINLDGSEIQLVNRDGFLYYSQSYDSGSSYNFSINNPIKPHQNCSVSSIRERYEDGSSYEIGSEEDGYIGSADVDIHINCVTDNYPLAVSVSGLKQRVVLRNNHSRNLSLNQDGDYIFKYDSPPYSADLYASGESYDVKIFAIQDNPTQNCTLENNSGVIKGEAATVKLLCQDKIGHKVSGSLVGLEGSDLKLSNNSAEIITLSSDGYFMFNQEITENKTYDVRVLEQPTGDVWQSCQIANGYGVMKQEDVTNVSVNCSTNRSIYLKPNNSGSGDLFGWPVDVLDNAVLVGADGESSSSKGVNQNGDDNAARHSGAAYLFERDGDAWLQKAYLKASNTDAEDWFGRSVAIDAGKLIVGAHREDGDGKTEQDNSVLDSGAVYVFEKGSSDWAQAAYLKATHPDAEDHFGHAVAVSGNILAVGAFAEDGGSSGINGDQTDNTQANAGAVYVFEHLEGKWQQVAYLKPQYVDADDQFGYSVAISGDTIVVGAPNESSNSKNIDSGQSNNSMARSGAAYIFVKIDKQWRQQAYLKPDNTNAGDRFGMSVSIDEDTVIVGAPEEDSNARGINGDGANNSTDDAGAAYVFVRDGVTWTQQAYLKATNTEAGDAFGYSVDVDSDLVAIGTFREDGSGTGLSGDQDSNSKGLSGAVYVFERKNGKWGSKAYLKANNTDQGDHFGSKVAISNHFVVVGADEEDGGAQKINGNGGDNSASNAGAAYIFSVQEIIMNSGFEVQ